MVVIEAAAGGTPTIVVDAPDNAAAELVEHQENGWVARSAAPHVLAAAIEAVHAAGPELAERTHAWFVRNAPHMTLDTTIGQLEALYGTIARGFSAANR